ncbi:hypothetical protein Kfla_6357 [Kribbella flavida DSM 17836]|uniref:Uncharacterized protein n=1 Tax=Kribbella flavida (strain DSM 17836 / JCM 10339 / NBRC 14399) TaxID=479435 RepID=D2PWX8_KRIFD|nr:hypothetical protein [Kribbella flavida]ADB35358.1 hypothetical protein Kfla_6357 [Kribbella flavida DSM 17836]
MPLTRRALLTTAAAVAAAPALTALPARARSALPVLAPLGAGMPDRRLFSPLEQRFAGYLAILAPMANDIVDADPATYGFMAGGWWRTPAQPFNARVQEHVFTLSWFYANRRPWNPYYRDAALLARLDAALQHYLKLQNPDGSWPEYAPGERGKASSGFGLGYLAKTLANLRQAGALPARRRDLEVALSKGTAWYLDPANPVVWDDPFQYTNQAVAGVAGAALTLKLIPDHRLQLRLQERIRYVAKWSQSPAGFFYDPRGMDINYNFEVMLPEMAELYLHTGHPALVTMARRFTDWFGYNLLREPDGSGWLTYYAVSDRTATAYYDDVIPDPDRSNLGSVFVPAVPNLGAFFTSREDRAATRTAWAADPAPVPMPAKQDTSPRIIAHAPFGEALPTEEAKRAAVARVPYLRRNDFTELRRDSVENQDYLYVRRPGFYLGAFFGTRAGSVVRAGTGFVWHPQAGTVIHAQQTSTGCWGTVRAGKADADGNLVAEYLSRDLVRYRTTDSSVVTELVIGQREITRRVTASSAATEQVPLVLQPGDEVVFSDGTPVPYNESRTATADGLTIRRGGSTVQLSWSGVRPVSLSTSNRTYLRDQRRRIHVLRIQHAGSLETTVRCD